ncbi:MAG: LysM peptidoglycan-binding domain-containing protein [Chloroflexi bacterium]|nr:LysM peptidoglycan-binding domain-containing protein [Chloroflexota bacterium]
MTDRSPAERPTACPFLAFEDDRDYRSDRPDHRHRCFAEARPAPRAISHQELFCLGGAFGECPSFASWAAREAAAVKRPTIRRTDAPATPRGTYPAERPSSGPSAGFAAVGGAYATPAGQGPSPAPPRPAGQPVPEWQAPPPWIADESLATTAPARPSSQAPAGQPPGAPPSPYLDDGETPAFLAGRTPRPPSAPSPAPRARDDADADAAPRGTAGAATTAAALGAAAGSAALIGGSAGVDDDLGTLVSGAAPPSAAGSAGSAAASRASAGTTPRPAPSSYPPPVSGRSSGASSYPRSAPSSDALWVEADVDLPAEDEAWEDPVEAAAAARIARASRSSGSSRFGLGRSKQSSTGQARPLPQRAADPAAPAWERPRRFEAYPMIKSGGGRAGGRSRGIPRVLVWAGLLALAALALFLIPPFLLGGGGGEAGASPTPVATAGASAAPSVAPTPVPSPTPFTYTVKAGDTLSGIAAKYKVSVDDMLAANPDLTDPNSLQVGQVLVIPLPASSVIPDAGTTEETPAP